MHHGVRLLLLVIVGCAGADVVHGEGTNTLPYPSKTVRLMLGPAPGSVADGITRAMATALSDPWPQQVVVENRPGTGNTIAPAIVAKSAPHDHTPHRCCVGNTISPALYKNLSDTHPRGFAILARIAPTPNILVVHPSLPVKTALEFVAFSRANATAGQRWRATPASSRCRSGRRGRGRRVRESAHTA